MDVAGLENDLRFSAPLYTSAEAAHLLGVAPSTFATWARGYTRKYRGGIRAGDAVLTVVRPDRPGLPSVPFIGLVEGMVLAAIRQSGVPLQRIRPALRQLRESIGIDHALGSRRLYTDGAEVLFDFAEHADRATAASVHQLVVVRNGQHVFSEIIEEYLRRIEYGTDDFARLVHLPVYRHNQVVADPTRSFGKPIFVAGGARVNDVLERFWAGETMDELVEEFGVPADDLEDAVRVASRRAA